MPPHHRSLLQVAEYVSVSASGIGSLVAIATQQIAYSVLPLSVTVALNLANRRQDEQRISQHIEQQLTQTTTSVQQIAQRIDGFSQHTQQFQEELQRLTQSIEQLQAEQVQLSPQITDITAQIQTLDQTLNQDIHSQVQALATAVGDLRDRLQQHDQQMSTFAPLSSVESWTTQLDQFRVSMEAIAGQMEQVEAIAGQMEQLAQLDQTLDDRFQQFSQTQQQVLTTHQQEFTVQQQEFTAQQQELVTQQTDINQRIYNLEPHIAQLADSLTQLQQNVESLQIGFRAIPIPSEPASPDPISRETPDADQLPSPEPSKNEWHNVVPQLPTDENYDVVLNLGIDFGTGFTKVCFRDLSQEQAEIVTFADVDASEHPLSLEQTLIPTKLAILENDTLLTGLTLAEWDAGDYDIKQTIDFIKMRLASFDVPSAISPESLWRLDQLSELDDPTVVESLCAYYLSQVIQRAQTWIKTHHADLFFNQTVWWSVNVGVPVKYCDSPALSRFQKVLALAWVLNHTDIDTSNLTMPRLVQLITHLQQWMNDNAVQDLNCTATPEIAAEVWSFLASRESQNGLYTFFDVGDGTLDGAAFRFCRSSDGDLSVDFYATEVEPLGVTALTQQAATELNCSPDQIRLIFSDRSIASEPIQSSPHKALHEHIKSSEARKSVQRLVASVVMNGHEKHQDARGGLHKNDLGPTLSVFVGGGGSNVPFFARTIEATHTDFRQGSAQISPYEMREIPKPKNLIVNGIEPSEFNRFAVAYGLCIAYGLWSPRQEGQEEDPSNIIRLPSEVESWESGEKTIVNEKPNFEDTKDMM